VIFVISRFDTGAAKCWTEWLARPGILPLVLDAADENGENRSCNNAPGDSFVLFMEPTQTSYDLRWRMLGIDVRIHPMFWLVSVLMGAQLLRMGVHFLLIWVACMFVSILVHELGHVWMGQAFGSHGSIVLYGFGGLAIGSNRLHQRWQRIAVSFAGPLAGFVFLGVLFLLLWIVDRGAFGYYVLMVILDLGLPIEPHMGIDHLPNPIAAFVVSQLVFINLMWGLVNLLPVWPLDGGMITRDVSEGLWPDWGLTRSLGLSLVVAGLVAVHCFLVAAGRQLVPVPIGGTYAGILFAVLALQSFQLLQQAQSQHRWQDDHWHDGDESWR
jgi:stage IV sporulation protein FB